ncbi:9729_t:CDS:2 [Cetraspora pellucida]|uniref:9729_t:CDS:1 n=1 Tax=Cetraspora pellucida TaxID=1433469 RepID=A0ACA9L068_9GLOM|nr:9729_t:CDS:2 [Cetraspora pellucida]
MIHTCEECGQQSSSEDIWFWCKPCNAQHFKQQFDSWSSENKVIDEFIQETQLNASNHFQKLEWIKYEKFTDVKYLSKGGFGKVYVATWKEGYIYKWNVEKKDWSRRYELLGETKVVLKSLNNSKNIPAGFFAEIKHQINSLDVGIKGGSYIKRQSCSFEIYHLPYSLDVDTMAESTTDRLTSTNVEGKSIDIDEAVITHCIFDMDAEILARFGKTYSLELMSRSLGLRQHEFAVLLINETGIDMTPDEFNKERIKKNFERFPFAKPMPGAMRLVTHLKKHRIPIAVATSSNRESFNIKASNNRELFDMFDSITCGNDANVKNGKPAPDLFLAACEKMGNPPTNQCLVFEDSINGIKAAKNANMKAIWVPDPKIVEFYSGKNNADEMIFSLNDFEPTKFGLPPFVDKPGST